jgi:hypothetical protein
MVVAILSLAACGSAPVKQTPQGLLKGSTDVSISFQNKPEQTRAVFNMTGYTIFSAPIIAVAVSKMNSQSAELVASYSQYHKDHPEIQSLKDTFNSELENNLLKRGLNITKVSAVKRINDQKVVTYDVNPSEVKSKWVVVIDGLASQYWAPSSTDSYAPQSFAIISIIDTSNPSAKPQQIVQKDDPKLGTAGPYSYNNFDSLSKDTGKSYEGLQQSVIRLADNVAKFLIENETKQ